MIFESDNVKVISLLITDYNQEFVKGIVDLKTDDMAISDDFTFLINRKEKRFLTNHWGTKYHNIITDILKDIIKI
jgi:hypothetical protein